MAVGVRFELTSVAFGEQYFTIKLSNYMVYQERLALSRGLSSPVSKTSSSTIPTLAHMVLTV